MQNHRQHPPCETSNLPVSVERPPFFRTPSKRFGARLWLPGSLAALLLMSIPACGTPGEGAGDATDDDILQDAAATLNVSTEHSELTVTGENLVADGSDMATIEVVLRDSEGEPVADVAVSLQAEGEAHTLTPAQGASDAAGQLSATLATTLAGAVDITAEIGTGDDAPLLSATISFAPGPPTHSESTLTAHPETGTVDGEDPVVLQAHVRDAHGNPVPEVAVSLTVGAAYTLAPAAGMTDHQGRFEADLTATAAGTATVLADVDEGSFTLTTDVMFQAPPATMLAQAMLVREVGDSGPMRIAGFGSPTIGPAGHVAYGVSFRDPDTHDFLSGSQTRYLISPGEPQHEPYFSSFFEAPDFPGFMMGTSASDLTKHAPAEDGSVQAMMIINDGEDEIEVAYSYHAGTYTTLFHRDDIPGLPDHRINTLSTSLPAFSRNRHGEWAIRLALCDDVNCAGNAWLRGQGETVEPLMVWGDGTGVTNADLGLQYYFHWPFLSRDHWHPSINNVGTIMFYASSKTLRDEHDDDEYRARRGLWTVEPTGSFPSLDVRTHQLIYDETTQDTDTLQDIAPQDQVFSMNDAGALTVLDNRSDDVLWFRNATGEWRSVARQSYPAPQVTDVGLEDGALFGAIHNAALSNSGSFSFMAAVGGKNAVWISDGENTRPVAVEGMAAPGLPGLDFYFISPHGSQAPLINNQDQVVFFAELDDGETFGSLDSIWVYDPCHGLAPIAVEGQDIELSGLLELVDWEDGSPVWAPTATTTRTIDRVNPIDLWQLHRRSYGPNMGLALPLNDAGEFVYVVRLLGDFRPGQIEEGDTGQLDLHDVLLKTQLAGCPTDTQ